MTVDEQKFERFRAALRDLCVAHGVQLQPCGEGCDYGLEVWDLPPGEPYFHNGDSYLIDATAAALERQKNLAQP